MDLLEKASIILTPTAYNNGEALCVKPSDGSGDFDFSRNSAATRVNAQGLVENVQILSGNLVQNGSFSEEGVQEVSNGSFSQEGAEQITNGSFDTDSGWQLTQATISNGEATFATTDGSFAGIRQNVFTIGKTYLISIEVSNLVGTAEVNTNGGTSIGLDITSVGTKSFYMVAENTDIEIKRKFGITNVSATIDNVSVREVGQDWTFGTGWSVGEDKAISDGSVVGNSYLISTGDTLTIGKTYKVQYTVLDYISGQVKVTAGQATQSFVNADGTYTEYMVATSTESVRVQANSNFYGSITNISVKEVGQNWELGDGWSIGDNVAVATSGAATKLTQSISGLSGKKCSVTFTLSNYGGNGNIKLDFGSVVGQNRNANGTYTEVGTYDIDRLEFYKNAGFEGSITNISVIEITDDTNLPRINYEGFSYQDALGSEEVLNGTFDTDTGWTKGTGWSISGGNATSDGSASNLDQSGTFLSGKTYKVVYDVLNYVSGDIRFRFTGTSNENGTLRNTNGTYTEYIKLANNQSVLRFPSSSFNGSIDNVSVKEYLGQEVVPDSGCGHWLWEPQSTNLITQSELFSDSSWLRVGSITTTDNYTTSPSGQNNATRLQWTNATNYIYQSLSHVGSDFTLSIYLKSNTNVSQNVRLFMDNGVQAQDVVVTTQWQRFETTNTITPTQSNRNVGLIKSGSQVGDLDISIWGAQFEAQSYPTSLIPTSGSSVTRNQDLCTNGGSLASINSTEGTLYAEIASLSNEVTSNYISLSDGTYNNRIALMYSVGTNIIRAFLRLGGTSQADLSVFVSDITEFHKVAFKYKENDFALWIDGVEVRTDTSGSTIPSGTLTKLAFSEINTTGGLFRGKTKALAVWKEALSDEELTELTTI